LTGATAPDGGTLTLAYQASLPIRSAWSGPHILKDGASTVWAGAVNGEVRAYYNNFLELDNVRVTSGFGVKYTRDRDGLITSVANVVGGTAVPTLTVARSALDGHVTGTTLGTVTTTNTYDISEATPGYGDLDGLTATAAGTTLFATTYEQDDIGRITQLTESIQGDSRTRRYEYDDEGRLVQVRDGSDAVIAAYYYDVNGNRTLAVVDGEGVSVNCPNGQAATDRDQLCTYGDSTYTYDANGALLEKIGPEGQTHYTYDGAGLLQKVELPNGVTIYYVHDAMGRRIAKLRKPAGATTATLVKSWLYADGLRPIAQLDSTGAVESTFVYATRANIPDYIVKKSGSSQVTVLPSP
jgi:YD repeat-containing protein